MRGENEGEVGILGEISAWPTYMPPTIYAPYFPTIVISISQSVKFLPHQCLKLVMAKWQYGESSSGLVGHAHK